MNLDQFPLTAFRVICDGSACLSGPVGEHVHESEWDEPLATVRVVDGALHYLDDDETPAAPSGRDGVGG